MRRIEDDDRLKAVREDALRRAGAAGDTLEELKAYCDNPYAARAAAIAEAFPLPDEPHIAAWRTYEQDARMLGAVEALKQRFAQLHFPIREGMRGDEEYRRATLRGHFPGAPIDGGLVLKRPSGLRLAICESMGGRIPVLTVEDRSDFVALVRAFTDRNEPNLVQPSMGACIVTGLNNWHRVALHRTAWTAAQGEHADDEAWAREFQSMIPRKELYQDRFIILSQGPYSAVSAGELGLPADEWLSRSLVLRREHEFLHYFTYRVFGLIRSNVFDELIADFVGLMAAFGTYRSDLALRFLGIGPDGTLMPDARIAIYRGNPPISDAALAIVCNLARRTAENLDAFARANPSVMQDLASRARVTFGLATRSLTELASGELVSVP